MRHISPSPCTAVALDCLREHVLGRGAQDATPLGGHGGVIGWGVAMRFGIV